jgi:Iron-containing redox enzyme
MLPPINAADYAFDERFLDSAFTVPTFELAISQFTETFFPEIIGVTLWLEWEVLGLWPTVKQFEHFEVDPHFYKLHIGIDNAAEGHGAKAKAAVHRFLDEARRRGGDAEVQALFKRILTGYVDFATTSRLGDDLKKLLKGRRESTRTPADDIDNIDDIIAGKKTYGSRNHGEQTLGGELINDLFEDSEAFRNALVLAKYIIPGIQSKAISLNSRASMALCTRYLLKNG